MGINVDELSITIKVDNQSAVTGIDAVIKKIDELNQAAGRGQGSFEALKGLSETLSSLGTAAAKIAKVDFSPLADGIKLINRSNIAAFTEKAAQLEEPLYRLGDASGYFGSRAKRAGDGAQSVAKAIKEFSDIDPASMDKIEPFFSRLSGMLEMMPKGVGKDLDLLAGSFYTLPEAMKNFVPPTDGAWERISSFLTRIAPLLKQFKEGADGGAKPLHDLATGLKTLTEVSQQPMLAENFRKVAEAVREFIQVINGTVNDADLQRFSTIAQSLYQVTEAYNHLATAQQKAGGDAARGVTRNAANVQKILNSFTSNLKKSATQVVAFGKRIAMFVTTPFRNFGSAILSIGKAIKGFFLRFARLAMLRLMRMAIMKIIQSLQEGIKNLYAWSTAVGHSFSQAMDTISTAGLYFKNSIAAMFSPLLEAIAPILDAIVDRVVAFINVINQLFALLTGKTVYTAAIKSAKAYGDAAGGAAAAQEKLNRTVLGFDELNRLNAPDDGGGGGGGGASGGEGMFEVRDISDLAERLFSDEDWTWLGTAVTDKLTEQMQKLDWDKIQASANGIARRVGTFLNGAFENKEFWRTLGTTVGEGINTVTGFIDTFFDTTEWVELGDSFAEFLRKGISTIDWAQLGQTITDVPRAITEMLHGFVTNWTDADWEMLGDSIAEMINNAFFNIDWATAIPDVVELATGILHAINTAIQDIEWADMFAELKKGFMTADWAGLWAELKEFLKNTMPVWSVALAITVGSAAVQTGLTAIRTMIVSAVASKVAASIAGAAGAGAAGAGAATMGKGVLGTVTGTVGIIPLAVTVAIVATVVLSIRRARKLTAIQEAAEQSADRYRTAFQNALEEGLIDENTFNRASGMIDQLDNLYWDNQQRNPWDTFGTQFENEADAITQGLETLLNDAGYDLWNFRNSEWKATEKITDKTKELLKDFSKSNSDEIAEMSSNVDSSVQTMATNTHGYIAGLRSKSNAAFSDMYSKGTTRISELSKTVSDKLSVTKTNGTTYIEALRKALTDKLSDAKTKGSSSIVSLVSDIQSKLGGVAKDASTYGANTGQNYANSLSAKNGAVGSAVNTLKSSLWNLDMKNFSYVWGADMGQNYANGIISKNWAVENAARTTAESVKKYLHFSEPDVGPLSDFHTYAPDMMRSFAHGIEANKQVVIDQLRSATRGMSEVFTGGSVNYRTSTTNETNYDGLIAALSSREETVNVYIGNSKLDTVIARSGRRNDLRTGGR